MKSPNFVTITSTDFISTQDFTSDPNKATLQLSKKLLIKCTVLFEFIRTASLKEITFDDDFVCDLESEIEENQFKEFDDSECRLDYPHLRIRHDGELSVIYPYKYWSGQLTVVVGDLSNLANQAGIDLTSTSNEKPQQDKVDQNAGEILIRDFMRELESTFDSLTMLGEVYGHRTMADLLYLQSAIANNSFIEHIEGDESSILEVVKQMPSSKRWEEFIHVNT